MYVEFWWWMPRHSTSQAPDDGIAFCFERHFTLSLVRGRDHQRLLGRDVSSLFSVSLCFDGGAGLNMSHNTSS